MSVSFFSYRAKYYLRVFVCLTASCCVRPSPLAVVLQLMCCTWHPPPPACFLLSLYKGAYMLFHVHSEKRKMFMDCRTIEGGFVFTCVSRSIQKYCGRLHFVSPKPLNTARMSRDVSAALNSFSTSYVSLSKLDFSCKASARAAGGAVTGWHFANFEF